jgi:tRNA (mo5U34)-methyltransferase
MTDIIDATALLQQTQHLDLPRLQPVLPQLLQHNFNPERFGDLPKWQRAVANLPTLTPSVIDLNLPAITIGYAEDGDSGTRTLLEQQLRQLHPWRKGPFDFFGVHIDTEWRSDLKWDRLKNHIAPLHGKTVLDVGCGSGYHCWRMRGAGAHCVVGIDPTPLFVLQFQAVQHYLRDFSVHALPARLEELPDKLELFDTTFSMGILYHRRSPFDHLHELMDTLKPGGQLVLETLVIDGKAGEVLVPEGRYSKMGNIWFIPSVATLEGRLKKSGFTQIECINVSVTTSEEQRSTDWMTFQSLTDFLDPTDQSKTLEGYPAPIRAILLAHKPA